MLTRSLISPELFTAILAAVAMTIALSTVLVQTGGRAAVAAE